MTHYSHTSNSHAHFPAAAVYRRSITLPFFFRNTSVKSFEGSFCLRCSLFLLKLQPSLKRRRRMRSIEMRKILLFFNNNVNNTTWKSWARCLARQTISSMFTHVVTLLFWKKRTWRSKKEAWWVPKFAPIRYVVRKRRHNNCNCCYAKSQIFGNDKNWRRF